MTGDLPNRWGTITVASNASYPVTINVSYSDNTTLPGDFEWSQEMLDLKVWLWARAKTRALARPQYEPRVAVLRSRPAAPPPGFLAHRKRCQHRLGERRAAEPAT